MTFLLYLTVTLFVIICVFLMLLVLIQKGRGGGLASAFGGAGGNTAFGSKTGDVLTWATSVVFGIFLILTVALTKVGEAWQNRRAATPGTTVTNPTRTPGQPASPAGQPPAPAPEEP